MTEHTNPVLDQLSAEAGIQRRNVWLGGLVGATVCTWGLSAFAVATAPHYMSYMTTAAALVAAGTLTVVSAFVGACGVMQRRNETRHLLLVEHFDEQLSQMNNRQQRMARDLAVTNEQLGLAVKSIVAISAQLPGALRTTKWNGYTQAAADLVPTGTVVPLRPRAGETTADLNGHS